MDAALEDTEDENAGDEMRHEFTPYTVWDAMVHAATVGSLSKQLRSCRVCSMNNIPILPTGAYPTRCSRCFDVEMRRLIANSILPHVDDVDAHAPSYPPQLTPFDSLRFSFRRPACPIERTPMEKPGCNQAPVRHQPPKTPKRLSPRRTNAREQMRGQAGAGGGKWCSGRK
jgi:hypothetical protein